MGPGRPEEEEGAPGSGDYVLTPKLVESHHPTGREMMEWEKDLIRQLQERYGRWRRGEIVMVNLPWENGD